MTSLDRFADALTAAWREPVSLTSAERLTGGASRETWALTVTRGPASLRVIARVERASVGDGTLGLETSAMTAAHAVGVPTPEVYASGVDDDGRFLLMELVEGETIPRRLLRDDRYAAAREQMAFDLGAVLGRLHTATPPAEVPTVEDPYRSLLADYGGAEPPAPGLALGLRRLRDHRPTTRPRMTLVHGDFRTGNLLVGADGLRAVLDWELVHVGDPVEDLGWLCAKVWRFGSPLPAGGFGSREQLLDGYASVVGWRPTAEELAWWELLATVKWGLMCGVMTRRHLTGERLSVELAAIGRRTCEQEFDVLVALGHDEPGPFDDVLDDETTTTADLYGRPGAADLAAGVRHYLVEGPMTVEGAMGFDARVAANVVDMLRREALLGPAARAAHAERLERLGVADDAALSEAILAGSLDDRWDDVVEVVRLSVRDRLAVANPRHVSRPA